VTRIAIAPPPACSGCFQSGPEKRYVDFESAWDGPVIPGSIPTPVDDLILCEHCLEEAFALIDPQGLRTTIGNLEAEIESLKAQLKSRDSTLRGAVSTVRELVDYPLPKAPGRPSLVGVDDETRHRIEKRRLAREKQNVRKNTQKKAEKLAREMVAVPPDDAA
jgi:uncharacterized small protein (DUF1192 family)